MNVRLGHRIQLKCTPHVTPVAGFGLLPLSGYHAQGREATQREIHTLVMQSSCTAIRHSASHLGSLAAFLHYMLGCCMWQFGSDGGCRQC